MNKLNPASLTRIVALLSVLVVLGIGVAMAGHLHDEDDDVRHDCALCAASSLGPFVDAHAAPSLSPAVALSCPLASQGPPLCALYRAHLLSRAPPVLA